MGKCENELNAMTAERDQWRDRALAAERDAAEMRAINQSMLENAEAREAGYYAGYAAGHYQGFDYAMAFLDEYLLPAQNSAGDLNFIMGLICGIPLGGYGKLPKEVARTAVNVLAYYISDVQQQNEGFKVGMGKYGLESATPIQDTFSTTNALELREAVKAYSTGADGGERFAHYLYEMFDIQPLLAVRTAHRPGTSADAAATHLYALINDALENPPADFQHEDFQQRDAVSAVLEHLKNHKERSDLNQQALEILERKIREKGIGERFFSDLRVNLKRTRQRMKGL